MFPNQYIFSHNLPGASAPHFGDTPRGSIGLSHILIRDWQERICSHKIICNPRYGPQVITVNILVHFLFLCTAILTWKYFLKDSILNKRLCNLLFTVNTLWTIYCIFPYIIFITFIIFLISTVIQVHCEILLNVYQQRAEKKKLLIFHYPDMTTFKTLLLIFFLASFFPTRSWSPMNVIMLCPLFRKLLYHFIWYKIGYISYGFIWNEWIWYIASYVLCIFPGNGILFHNTIWRTLYGNVSKIDDLWTLF